MKATLVFILSLLIIVQSIGQEIDEQGYRTDIIVGAEQPDLYLPLIKDKSVAIVSNQTSLVGNTHLVDTLISLGVNIKHVFAPEHGFRGEADAGAKLKDGIDEKTGLKVYSLYGRTRKPTAEMVEGLDVIIFDIQDVGARFYTYISTMHYIMEVASENDIDVIILDRPNPNGHYVDGFVLEEKYKSFVGMHPVPVVHGMTVGEYAKMINGEGWLPNSDTCSLKVIPCKNYTHKDRYKLPVRPSPNLPNMASIYLYPSICSFEGTSVSVGRGTPTPFQHIGSPFYEEKEYSFVPEPMLGASKPKHNGERCYGYNLQVFGQSTMPEIGQLYLHWLVKMYQGASDKETFFVNNGFFNLLAGTDRLRMMLEEGKSAEEIRNSWEEEVNSFKSTRKKYLIYRDFE